MRYFLDCEFNGWKGRILTLGLAREDGEVLYLVWPVHKLPDGIDPWVRENVVPIIASTPPGVEMTFVEYNDRSAADKIAEFLQGDPHPYIVTDWPDDIRYFCENIITSPGYMADIPHLIFDMVRVNAYPTNIEHAVQHNAAWDALALRDLFKK